MTLMWHCINAFIMRDSWWQNNHNKYVCVKDGTLAHNWWAVHVGRRWLLARKPMRKCFILPAKWGDFVWSSLLQMAVYGLILEQRSEPYCVFCSICGRHTLDCEEKFLFEFHLSCRRWPRLQAPPPGAPWTKWKVSLAVLSVTSAAFCCIIVYIIEPSAVYGLKTQQTLHIWRAFSCEFLFLLSPVLQPMSGTLLSILTCLTRVSCVWIWPKLQVE